MQSQTTTNNIHFESYDSYDKGYLRPFASFKNSRITKFDDKGRMR